MFRKLRVVLLAFMFLLVVNCIADDKWEELSLKMVDKLSCKTQDKFFEVFKLSTSNHYTSVADIEMLSEVNEITFLNCPKEFLLALKQLPLKSQDVVLNYFGVVVPPWELSSKLKLLKDDKIVGKFVKKKFANFFLIKKP